jgi:hypothetical protein
LKMQDKYHTNFDFIKEPNIKLGYTQSHIDPRDGLTLYGPITKDDFASANIGVIGPERSRIRMKNWLKINQAPVYSFDSDIARPSFPGFQAVFGTALNYNSMQEISIEDTEILKYLKHADSHQRIFNLVKLFSDQLIRYVNDHKPPVQVWFVVIPEEVYQYGKPNSRIPKAEGNIPIGIKSQYSKINPFLFPEYDYLQEAYKYELNFHNQLKARLLKDRIITQIVRESTIAYKDFKNKYNQPLRDLAKFESAISWNISTSLYYKLGGTPWKLSTVRDKVCYLGLVYKKIDTDKDPRIACCAAQMFLDSGDGLVFKGNTGRWYDPFKNEYHLDKESAKALIIEAIESYKKDNSDNYPRQIFIHAKTYFNDEEWEGFFEACEGKTKLVGVRIKPEASFKMYRDYAYPAPRGLTFFVNDKKAFLWTKGFIPKLQTVVGLETPNPLSIEIIRGSEDIKTVCEDVLSLTKLNYNTCLYGDGLPVTLRFANNVGEVITAGPNENLSRLSFRHYI